jgi:hypothetical protein
MRISRLYFFFVFLVVGMVRAGQWRQDNETKKRFKQRCKQKERNGIEIGLVCRLFLLGFTMDLDWHGAEEAARANAWYFKYRHIHIYTRACKGVRVCVCVYYFFLLWWWRLDDYEERWWSKISSLTNWMNWAALSGCLIDRLTDWRGERDWLTERGSFVAVGAVTSGVSFRGTECVWRKRGCVVQQRHGFIRM